MAYPIGNFASNDLSETNSGFASQGFNLKFEHKYPVKKYIELVMQFNYISNPINSRSLKNYIELSLPPGALLNFNTGEWKQTMFLLGFNSKVYMKSSPIGFNARILMGANSTSNPEIIYSYLQYGTQRKSETFISPTVGFAYQLGAGLQISLSNKFDLNYNTYYSGSMVEFVGVLTNVSQKGRSVSSTKTSFKQDLSSILVTFGITFTP